MAALFLFAAGIGTARAQSDALARPAVKAGDRWLYVRTDPRSGKSLGAREERVTFASDAVIHAVVVRFGREEEVDATFSASWNSVSSADGGVFSPDTGTLRFPLAAGASWPANYENRRPRRGAFHVVHERTAKAVGWEDIVVPAGRFRALKVEVQGSFRRLDTGIKGTTRTVVWYVPSLRRWAKFTYEDHHDRGGDAWIDELVDFKVA